MKNKSVLYMVSALAFFLISSCSKSFLDTVPETEFSDKVIWTNFPMLETYVNNIYNNLPYDNYGYGFLVDEGRGNGTNGDDRNYPNMIITPDIIPSAVNWSLRYADIRLCNSFLENIDKLPSSTTLVDGKTLKDRITGEVTFLRAWNYQLLVSYHGGVPLITKAYKLNDDFTIERSSYADCVKFISDECDKAAALLPDVNTGSNNGRATKGAALALKSRILLYAASDLHNTTKFSGFSNPNLLGFTDGNRTARWQAAKAAAKAVIDLGRYSLYKPDPASGDEASKNYHDFFISKKSAEDIFVRFFAQSIGKGFSGLEVTPNGWNGWGASGAINELVDDYEMADGTRFSRSNPAQEAEPYKNRDPRFYGTLLYEGAKWRVRPGGLAAIDPVGVLQVGYWEKWDIATNKMVLIYGLDSRGSVNIPHMNNKTGTTNIKFLDPAVNIDVSFQDLTYRYFRYAEILLNYAEACIELGDENEARTYLNMIRKRAFMPNITESGTALKARYRNERRIEMAFENQRFFDVHRWLIGPEAYNDVHGVAVVYKLNPDRTTNTIPKITPIIIQIGSWDDKAYFMPIRRDEMNKNIKLVQNPGYF